MSPRVLVALETSGPIGSVAVAVDGALAARRFLLEAREHAAGLLPALAEALAAAGVERTEIGGVVVGAGPGSFTGVRVAAATAKGLVHALDRPLWAVSSLEAAAIGDRIETDGTPWSGAPAPAALRGRRVVFDARGRRVFTADYEVQEGHPRVRRAPRFSTIDALLAEPPDDGTAWCGQGALRHGDELRAAGVRVLDPPAGVPTAEQLLRIVLGGGGDRIAAPADWEPDYLRATGAERARPDSGPAA